MKIRKAEKKDIPRILALLGQVLQIHAEIRPDIFIPGTTKYTPCELTELLQQEDHPIYVAVDEDDLCMGYAFCQLREQPFSTNMVPFKSLFIDDLCVDKQTRGQHIGESLFEYVKQPAPVWPWGMRRMRSKPTPPARADRWKKTESTIFA